MMAERAGASETYSAIIISMIGFFLFFSIIGFIDETLGTAASLWAACVGAFGLMLAIAISKEKERERERAEKASDEALAALISLLPRGASPCISPSEAEALLQKLASK